MVVLGTLGNTSLDSVLGESAKKPKFEAVLTELAAVTQSTGAEMKREYDGGDHYGGDERGGASRNKRNRVDGFSEAIARGRFELRLLVSSKAAGAVIGKGGENIKRLRSEFDSQINVPDSSAQERVITVVAVIDNLLRVVEEMLTRLDEPTTGEKAELRILVHQSHAGALIGRSGCKIKELRDKCSIRLKVFQATCPGSTDRTVIVSGEPANCIDALRHIVNDLKELPIKGPVNQYSPQFNSMYPMQDPFEYGGYGSAGGGRGGRSGQDGGGYQRRDDYGRSGGSRSGGGGGSYGPPSGGQQNYGGGYHAGGPAQGGHYPPPHHQGGHPPISPAGGGPVYSAGYGPPGGQITTTQVTIPNELSGTIIGRGGERINRIRDESGATIILEQSQPGCRERIITISGTDHQIQSAQYHLQQCVRSSENGRRYIQQQERGHH